MKFKYVGKEVDVMTLRGIDFPYNKAIEVEDESFAARLENLDYFEAVKPGRKPNAKNVE